MKRSGAMVERGAALPPAGLLGQVPLRMSQTIEPKNRNEFEQEEAERAEVQELITKIATC